MQLSATVRAAIVGAWRAERVILLAALCGLALRGYQISGQILADDEWHALYAMTFRSYVSVLSHFGGSDYSIPLTLLYKTLANTVGLTEMAMRAPMLICGVGAIVALPLLIREYVGRRTAHIFAWLLAIAPLHVYFSRWARPYSITMLLATVAVVAFFKWLSGGPRQWAWMYVAGAVAAPCFHLAVLPVVLSPILFGLVDGILRHRRHGGRTPGEVVTIGVAVGAGLAALLSVPLIVDAPALAQKTGMSPVRWATLRGAVHLFAGTSQPWLGAAMGALVVTGCAWLARRQLRFALYVAVLAAGQILLPVLMRPYAIEVPIVLARYSLPLLPFLLLGAATGITGLDAALARWLPVYRTGPFAATVVGLLFVFGPLPAIYRYPNNWTNHALFEYEYDPTSPYTYVSLVRPHRISPFYAQLAALPHGALLIVEAPWYYAWYENPYPFYQAVHRQRMAVGFVAPGNRFVREGELPRASGVRFRNAMHVRDAARDRQRQVRYVVFHKHLHEEFPKGSQEIVDVTEWIQWYGRAYGAPIYQDADIVVFDLGAR